MNHEVKAQVVIDLPREAAWEKLRDISLAHNYVPGIVNTEIVSDIVEGVGASRYVYRNGSSYIQETVTEWQDLEGFRIRLHKGDAPAPPFREAYFRYHLADQGTDKTLFTASMQFDLPWGGLGRLLGTLLTGVVQKTIADVACSMKLYYETGEPTSPAALKAYKASLH